MSGNSFERVLRTQPEVAYSVVKVLGLDVRACARVDAYRKYPCRSKKMLRKAFGRSGQTPIVKETGNTLQQYGGVESPGSKRTRTSGQTDLEGIVLADSEDVISEIGDASKKKKIKRYIKKRTTLSEMKSAWEDDYEKAVKSGDVSSTPQWAKLKVQREEDDEIESDIGHYLLKTGDLLAKSTSLPPGMLQIRKLADANADDTRDGRLQNVEFHPTAKVVMTAGTTHRVNLFQIDGQNNQKIQSVFFEDYPIHTAHFSANGNEIIVGSNRKNFLFYDMVSGRVVNVPKIKGLEGTNMARFEVSPDGRYLAFLGKYGSIHLISARSKEWISTVKMNGDVHCLSFSSDGSKMFSFGSTGTVFVWDMNSRNCLHTFVDEGCVHGTAIANSPNDQYIACGSQSGIVNIYNQDSCQQECSPKPLKSIMNLTTLCNKAKFNCSSEMLAVASSESPKSIKLIHFPSMHVFANFPEQSDRQLQIPKCLDFSPNGGYMVIGNQRGHALLYRLSNYSAY